MRVLFLAAANSVHTIRWVNALAERGCEVVLVSERNHQAKEDDVTNMVKIIYLPFGGAKGYYLNALALRRIYKAGRFNVINVHYASGYGTLARMAKLPEIILNVWGSDVYDFPYESPLKKHILRKNLAYAEKLASTSYSMARQTEKFLVKKREIAVTHFGVDTEKFKPEESSDKKGNFVFGIVKTLTPKYGIATVIKAFAAFVQKIAREEKEKIRLEIYGKGELMDELKTFAAKLHLEKQIFFGGYVENRKIPSLLNRMDVFMLGSTSDSESFGVAAVEAMSCGLPIVATSVSGFREVVEDGKTGFLVPVGDYEAMAEKMFQLYGDAGLRKSMGKAGRKRVQELYNWEKNVDEMMRIYRERGELKC